MRYPQPLGPREYESIFAVAENSRDAVSFMILCPVYDVFSVCA